MLGGLPNWAALLLYAISQQIVEPFQGKATRSYRSASRRYQQRTNKIQRAIPRQLRPSKAAGAPRLLKGQFLAEVSREAVEATLDRVFRAIEPFGDLGMGIFPAEVQP